MYSIQLYQHKTQVFIDVYNGQAQGGLGTYAAGGGQGRADKGLLLAWHGGEAKK